MAYSSTSDVKDKLYRVLYYFELMTGYSILADEKNLPSALGSPDSEVIDGFVAKVGISATDFRLIANEYTAWKKTVSYEIPQYNPFVTDNTHTEAATNNFLNGSL